MIAPLPLPMPQPTQRGANPEGPSGSKPDGQPLALPFAMALALQSRLTEAEGPTEGVGTHAAAIRPQIGASAQAFSASSLLVETALPLSSGIDVERGTAAPVTAARLAAGSALPVELPAALTAAMEGAVARITAGASPASGESALPSGQKGAITPGSRALPAASPMQAPGGLALRGPADSAARNGEVTGTARPAPPARHHAGGAFAIHCLQVEGGIRLLVKLARLPDDQRGELEMRLRDLFGAFGLDLRELEFHETAA